MKKLTMIVVLVLACAMIFPVSAQKLEYSGFGAGVGLIMPEDPFDTGFNIAGYVNMGELADNLVLVPGLSYWSSGGEIYGIDLSMSNFAINGDVHYFFDRKQEGPYAGGGLGINFLSAESASPTYTIVGQTFGGDTHSDSETKIGFQLLGGYMMEVSNMMGFVEAKYNIISDFNTFQLNVGVWFNK